MLLDYDATAETIAELTAAFDAALKGKRFSVTELTFAYAQIVNVLMESWTREQVKEFSRLIPDVVMIVRAEPVEPDDHGLADMEPEGKA